MFEFSTATILWGERPLERACREIASLGLRHVDLWHVPNWCEHLRDGPDAARETLARHGLRLQAISAYGASVERLGELLPVLANLGGDALVTGSDKPDVPLAAYAAKIRPLVERATEIGVVLAIENHRNACVDSIASMVELVERLPMPGLGIALAPIHLHIRRESTVEAIGAVRDRIALFYVWDWGPTADANWKDPTEQFVGTGVIDYRPIFPALAEVGHARPLDLLAYGPEHWPPERATERARAALERARALVRETVG